MILSVLSIMFCMFLTLLPTILIGMRLGCSELLDIFIIGYFGLIFDFSYQICNIYCTYIFKLVYLSSFSYHIVFTYKIIYCVYSIPQTFCSVYSTPKVIPQLHIIDLGVNVRFLGTYPGVKSLPKTTIFSVYVTNQPCFESIINIIY